jgi:hypothetical protein
MPKPNEDFNLSVEELQLIEMSLIAFRITQDNRKKEIQDLLAKFYHQKVWYRPKGTYISG